MKASREPVWNPLQFLFLFGLLVVLEYTLLIQTKQTPVQASQALWELCFK